MCLGVNWCKSRREQTGGASTNNSGAGAAMELTHLAVIIEKEKKSRSLRRGSSWPGGHR